jgi:RNA polymerase sigma-70 factor (ECF subfamily)
MTNADAFEVFVRTYQDMVFATAVRLLGEPAEAEDVAQQVFLKAFERFDEIGSSPAAAGWLKTVARNMCLNHLSRYRSRWRFFSELARTDAAGDEAAFDVSGPADASPVQRMEQADDRDRLELALRALPQHQRVPLVLFHFEEVSYDEIASTLGISLAKVKTDIHRGREALRKVLDVRLRPDTTTRLGHGSR